MTLNGAIMQLTELWNHPTMPVQFKPAIEKVIETVSELEEHTPERTEPHDKGFTCPENRKCMCFQCDSKGCEHWTAEIPNIPTYHMNGELVETPDKRTETHSCDCGRKETHGDVIYRQAAIDAIRHIEDIYVNNLPTMIDKASAQTELMLLPSAEPEQVRTQMSLADCISRQAAIDAIIERDANCGLDSAEVVKRLPSAEPEQRWIPVTERLPECEQEVLICTKRKVYRSKNSGLEWIDESIVTPALYEDGTMLEVNSQWRWEDVDWAGWDEEEDCGIIPEGWWENRHFNPDDTYNCPVDKEVIAWMPLPEPYSEGRTDE